MYISIRLDVYEILTCLRMFIRTSKRPKIPGYLHVASKRPESLGRSNLPLNVLKFQNAIFTYPWTSRPEKIWITEWINTSCPEIR